MLRNSTNEILIRPKWSRDKKITVISVSIITAVGLLLGSYKVGYRKANFDSAEHGSYIYRLEKKLSSVESQAKQLQKKLAVAQRDSQVQQAAYGEINKTYQKVDDKNEELNRKLNFYRSIISPEDGRSGVKIHDISTTLDADGRLGFEVVMIQSIDHSSSQNVAILIELMESKKARNNIQQWPKSGQKMIDLRYSDVINGVFKDVQIKSDMVLKITARPNGRVDKQLVEWHEL